MCQHSLCYVYKLLNFYSHNWSTSIQYLVRNMVTTWHAKYNFYNCMSIHTVTTKYYSASFCLFCNVTKNKAHCYLVFCVVRPIPLSFLYWLIKFLSLLASFNSFSPVLLFTTLLDCIKFIRCVLVRLSSDIPASRKAAGYLGHMAKKACSRSFPTLVNFGVKRDRWAVQSHSIQF